MENGKGGVKGERRIIKENEREKQRGRGRKGRGEWT